MGQNEFKHSRIEETVDEETGEKFVWVNERNPDGTLRSGRRLNQVIELDERNKFAGARPSTEAELARQAAAALEKGAIDARKKIQP